MTLTGKEVIKRAKKKGWRVARINGSHHILQKENFLPVAVPVHSNKDLAKGLEKKLIKELGL